jgi:hypothetical protein
MKKVVKIGVIIIIALTALAGASILAFKLGWKHGRFDATSMHSSFALKLAKAMGAQEEEKARRWMAAILMDVERDTLAFDDTWTVPYYRYVKDSVILDLDAHWQTNQRIVAIGSRVDESNIQKYGLAGGRAINSGREAYEAAYSNAVQKARERQRR